MTKVVHIKKEPWDVMVCRNKFNRIPPPPEVGCFGNPFPLNDTKDDVERAEVIRKYKEYFLDRVERDEVFREAVLELKGKKLACWCSPKPCHGDVIVEWLENHDLQT